MNLDDAALREQERKMCDEDLRHRWMTRIGERRYTCGECGADVIGVLDRAIALRDAAYAEQRERDAKILLSKPAGAEALWVAADAVAAIRAEQF